MIRLEHVSKAYDGGVNAVNDVSFEVPRGEIAVLVGPSGCGKTTTLKMINRLHEPTSGKIFVDDVDTSTVDPIELRRNIGYVIQDVGLFPHMTIAENIAVVPHLKKWDRKRIAERVDELLTMMGMPPAEYRNRYPRELSGGQRQRIGVARAMASDPPILLMDEPFGALDPITRERLQNEFLKIQEKLKKTIVFVTHDIDEAIKLGDKVAIMRKGRLIQYDTPSAVLNDPADEFVADFVGQDRTLKSLRLIRTHEVMDADPPALRIQASAAEALSLLSSSGQKYAWVVGDARELKGLIARKDALEADASGDATIADIVNTNVVSVERDRADPFQGRTPACLLGDNGRDKNSPGHLRGNGHVRPSHRRRSRRPHIPRDSAPGHDHAARGSDPRCYPRHTRGFPLWSYRARLHAPGHRTGQLA